MDLLKKRTLRYLKGHKYGDLEKMIRGKGAVGSKEDFENQVKMIGLNAQTEKTS